MDWADLAAARASVVAAVKAYLGADTLQFVMELSIDPIAAQLELVQTP